MLEAVARLVTKRPGLIAAAAAMLGAVALVFGAGVAKSLAPFGFDDPATESVKARETVERTAGYDPDLVVTAIVRPLADVDRVSAELRKGPVVRVTTVARNNDAAVLVAFLRPISDEARDKAAKRLEKRFEDDPHVELGGGVIGYEQVAGRSRRISCAPS